MKPLLVLVLFLAAIARASAQAPSPSPGAMLSVKSARDLAIFAPRPNYPTDAKGVRPTGRGLVLMKVDPKTGSVSSATVEKTTGNKLLDDAALEAFRQWRFPSGKIREVHCPITFSQEGTSF